MSELLERMGMMPILSCEVGRVSPQHCAWLSSESSFLPRLSGSHGEGRSKTLDGKTLVAAEGHTALSFASVANALEEHAGGWCGI
jgi:hypothetical protein